ncbi:MAG: hypothetical protein LIP16_16905 [Clostridium sp.]|nr:hypothetical protein [Clostridium sp.]
MYEYTWYQWLMFFFLYCFFGWIFESSYVSLKTRRFVNRGFLRLPMLPLYGTGAVMMLWVSLPVKDNLFMVYISGVAAATLLEYVTGWGMERLFKMKYWDYSSQKFNLKGYICLSSSIAWGFLTILLTEVIHRPIERYVLGLPVIINIIVVSVTSILFAADAAQSVKAALDLAKVLDAMTNMRAELDEIQVQMALLKAETSQRILEAREDAAQRLDMMKSDAVSHAAALKEDTAERLSAMVETTVEKVGVLVEGTAQRVGTLVEGTADKVARTAERLSEFTEDAASRVTSTLSQRSAPHEDGHEPADHSQAARERRDRLAVLTQRLAALSEKRRSLSNPMGYYRKSLLKGNPSASSSRFAEALRELREIAEKKK